MRRVRVAAPFCCCDWMDVCEYRFTFQLGKKANMLHFLSVRWVIIELALYPRERERERERERSKKDPPTNERSIL